MVVDHLENRIARDIDPLGRDPLAHQVVLAVARVRQQHVARVVDQATVHLLRHTVIVASVSGFHVVHRHAKPLGRDGAQAGVGIAEHEEAIGALTFEDLLEARHDGAQLLAEAAAGAEVVVRRAPGRGLSSCSAMASDLVPEAELCFLRVFLPVALVLGVEGAL